MTIGELIEQLIEYPLDATVTVFYDRYAGGGCRQGTETPVVVGADPLFVVLAAEYEANAARHWCGVEMEP